MSHLGHLIYSFHLIKADFPLKERITLLTFNFPFSKKGLILFWCLSHVSAISSLTALSWGPFAWTMGTHEETRVGGGCSVEGRALGLCRGQGSNTQPSYEISVKPWAGLWNAPQLSFHKDERQEVKHAPCHLLRIRWRYMRRQRLMTDKAELIQSMREAKRALEELSVCLEKSKECPQEDSDKTQHRSRTLIYSWVLHTHDGSAVGGCRLEFSVPPFCPLWTPHSEASWQQPLDAFQLPTSSFLGSPFSVGFLGPVAQQDQDWEIQGHGDLEQTRSFAHFREGRPSLPEQGALKTEHA